MKNSIKNASYNAFGFIFPSAVALFTTPYIVNKLTPEIYGLYVLAISLIGLMSFMDLGFGQGIIKFVSQYDSKKDYDKINRIIGVTLFIYLVTGVAGCILLFSVSGFLARDVFNVSEKYVQTASLAFKIVSLGFLINFINGVFSNIPKALQRYDISVKIQNSVWFFINILTVLLLYIGKSLIEVLIAWILIKLAGLIIYYGASKKILPSLSIMIKFDRAVFREIFSFNFFTAANSITGNIVVKVDKLIIGGFLGTASVAFYNIPYTIAQMGGGFIGAITQHLFPRVSYINGSGNREKLVDVYKRSLRYVISISLIITIALILLGDSFLKLWMGQEFASKSSGILPILALVFFFSCITSVTLWFYMGLGYSPINLLSSSIGSACYLLGAFFLVPKFGLHGAALSFTLILVPFPFYHYYLFKKIVMIDLKWYLNIVLKSLLLLISAFVIRYSLNIKIETIPSLFISGLVIAVISSILLLVLGIFDQNEGFFIIKMLKLQRIVDYYDKI